MEHPKAVVFAALVLLAGSLLGAEQDADAKRQCARRLLDRFGLVLDHGRFTLPTLLDIEARLQACARIRQKHKLIYDYRAVALDKLEEVEARLDARDRLIEKYNVSVASEYYTLSQIQDLEARLKLATRVYQQHGKVVDWQNASLEQLQVVEASLTEAHPQPPSPPSRHALPLSAVVYYSATPTAPSSTVSSTYVKPSNASDAGSAPAPYASAPAPASVAYASRLNTASSRSSYTSSGQRRYVARVASRPRYTSYYRSSYSYGGWYTPRPIVYGNVIQIGSSGGSHSTHTGSACHSGTGHGPVMQGGGGAAAVTPVSDVSSP